MKENGYWLKFFEDGDGTNEIQSLHNNYGLKNDSIKLGLSMRTKNHHEKKGSSTIVHATTSSNCKTICNSLYFLPLVALNKLH